MMIYLEVMTMIKRTRYVLEHQVCLRVSESMYQELQEIADFNCITVSELVRKIVKAFLTDEEIEDVL